jgi:hypothetical protein
MHWVKTDALGTFPVPFSSFPLFPLFLFHLSPEDYHNHRQPSTGKPQESLRKALEKPQKSLRKALGKP